MQAMVTVMLEFMIVVTRITTLPFAQPLTSAVSMLFAVPPHEEDGPLINQKADPKTCPYLDPGFPRLQNYEKYISIVYEPPSLFVL